MLFKWFFEFRKQLDRNGLKNIELCLICKKHQFWNENFTKIKLVIFDTFMSYGVKAFILFLFTLFVQLLCISRGRINLKLQISRLAKRSWLTTSFLKFCEHQQKRILVSKIHGSHHKNDNVINRLLLSRGVPGGSLQLFTICKNWASKWGCRPLPKAVLRKQESKLREGLKINDEI